MANGIINVGASGKLKNGKSFEIIDFKKFAVAEDGSIHSGVAGVVVDEKYGVYPISVIAENIDYEVDVNTSCMTVREYNKEFLPKIEHAQCFISRVELAIDHMDIGECGRNEVRRILGLYCWDKDTEKTILTALEYYRIHEGIEKLELNSLKDNFIR